MYVSCPVERLRALLQTLIVPADLARRYGCWVTSVRPPTSWKKNRLLLLLSYWSTAGVKLCVASHSVDSLEYCRHCGTPSIGFLNILLYITLSSGKL